MQNPLPAQTNSIVYDGEFDEFGFRTKFGLEQWPDNVHQSYKGNFWQNSLHGRGKYVWKQEKTSYEGMFYSNNLEGYGKFQYGDFSTFEGLFKSNHRFGPGVFTYRDGSQDVGLWYGKDLIRLCCTVNPEWIPRFSRTPSGKIKLLKFRKLVTVCDDFKDDAKEILRSIEANHEVMKQSQLLYNVHIQNPNSSFFNKSLYNYHYFCEQHCYIDVVQSLEEIMSVSSNKLSMDEETVVGDGYQVCLCEDQKTILLNQIRSDLQRTEEILKEIDREIEKAKCAKDSFEMKKCNASKEESGTFDGEECLCSKKDIKEYKATCRLLKAAQSAEKLFLRKKDELINNLTRETENYEQCGQEHERWLSSKKIHVSHLLAWNNQEIPVDMLKHVFAYRNFEKYNSFCIEDLLIGNRDKFGKVGTYEETCVSFLEECSNGNVESVTKIFLKYDLNPDLSDAKGNSGIMFAAARDRTKIIKTLVNFGANVDIFNDECFTPLNMCIARYISVKENVHDWEEAFLKGTILEDKLEQEVIEWRPHKSLISINNFLQSTSCTLNQQIRNREFDALSELFGSNVEITEGFMFEKIQDKLLKLKASSFNDLQPQYLPNSFQAESQRYLLSTEIVIPIPPPKTKKPNKRASKATNKPKKEKLRSSVVLPEIPEKSEPTSEEMQREKQLNAITLTIETLLKYGANPNLCQVPLPSLIFAVFTRNYNLVKSLLLNGADPNVVTLDENLTPLHVVVSLPPCQENVETLRVLLKHSANPNLKVSLCHWREQKVNLMANRELICNDQGKTPLHILSMRYDFKTDTNKYLTQMADVLITNKTTAMYETYLGHSPLSLAVLRGNIDLTRAILESKLINPNQELGEEMGLALAIYTLNRYKNILPELQTCQEIIKTLIGFKANPFTMVEGIGNLLDFIDKEKRERPVPLATNKKKPKLKKKISKNKEKVDLVQDEIIDFLESVAKTVIERHIQGYAVKYLYVFVTESEHYDSISENMARFLTPEDAIRIAQMLLHKGEIPLNEETNYKTIYNLIELIINANFECENDEEFPSSLVDIDQMLESFDFSVIPDKKNKLNLREPETDKHSDMYNVCFNCCRKLNRQLYICPDCLLVYYCSKECEESYYQQSNPIHKCGSIFYETRKALHQHRIHKGQHWKHGTDARKLINEGMFKKQEESDNLRKLHFKNKINESQLPSKTDDGLGFLHTTIKFRKHHDEKSMLSLHWELSDSQALSEKMAKLRQSAKDKKTEKGKTSKLKTIEDEEKEKHKEAKASHPKKSKSEDEYEDEDKAKHKKSKASHPKKSDSEDQDKSKPKRSKASRLKKSDSEDDSDYKDKGKHKKSGFTKSKSEDEYEKDEMDKHKKSKKPKFKDELEDEDKGKRKKSEPDKKFKSRDEDKDKLKKSKRGQTKKSKSEDEDEDIAKHKERHKQGKSKDSQGKDEKKKYRKVASSDEESVDKRKKEKSKLKPKDKESSEDEHEKPDRVGRKKKDTSSERKSDRDESESKRARKSHRDTSSDRESSRDESKSRTSKKDLKQKEKAEKGKESIKPRQDKHKVSDQIGGKEKGPDTSRLVDQLGRFKTESAKEELGYTSMPVGGRIVELQRRLPSKYQYFLEKISQLWPDLDLSLLFLPYACFSNGQLYYRFLTNKTVFMETYSNI